MICQPKENEAFIFFYKKTFNKKKFSPGKNEDE